ncbi:DUF4349 domain-containing protein [Kaistella jeonii]|uniref:DUF4349 domain-containing protein n=1 Tax=Kaistella jeonii TaxID=266749 RepID=A0A0C1F7U4_9FLAO|nr:DUF4349 domain-containing protein [Kaistella jeonii]KIA89267.1 hypothetical protein OA86_06615 [Kaistella jeonii]SFC01487.1 protein of unknown function [Kaistella jeonii]VEI96578.1 Uncharacterised protein [Kaistella jeonii]
MKNLILSIVTVLSLVACKKQEGVSTTGESSSSITKGDSLSMNNSAGFDSTQNSTRKNSDSLNSLAKDTSVAKIQKLNNEKKLLTEKVAKEMDSSTRSAIISEIKITQKKIDSVRNNVVLNRKKQITAPKIVRERKIIYLEKSTRKEVVITPKITKKGALEIEVEDMETAQFATKEQVFKYNGIVKSEQISSDKDQQFDFLKISVPLDKSEYLIKDLENNVGKIISRNIQINGEEYSKNSVCHLEITLVKNSKDAIISAIPKTFGGRTLGAVGTGWNVIQEIFLFILPFWPVLLIGGGIYFYFKKKKTAEANQ